MIKCHLIEQRERERARERKRERGEDGEQLSMEEIFPNIKTEAEE